jgi:hypothetical protein
MKAWIVNAFVYVVMAVFVAFFCVCLTVDM